MTRLFRPSRPRLADWRPPATESERAFSVVDADRDEHRSAARHDRFEMTRVGDRWIDDPDLPSKGDE